MPNSGHKSERDGIRYGLVRHSQDRIKMSLYPGGSRISIIRLCGIYVRRHSGRARNLATSKSGEVFKSARVSFPVISESRIDGRSDWQSNDRY